MLKQNEWKIVLASVLAMALINRVGAAKAIVQPAQTWM